MAGDRFSGLIPNDNVYVIKTAADLPQNVDRWRIYHLLYDPGAGAGLYYSPDAINLVRLASGGATIPAGTVDNSILRWDSGGAVWTEFTSFILPLADGAANQLMQTDGLGVVTWVDPPASGITIEDEGAPLATAADTLDFVGDGVVASGVGTTKTIDVLDQQNVSLFLSGLFGTILNLSQTIGPNVQVDLAAALGLSSLQVLYIVAPTVPQITVNNGQPMTFDLTAAGNDVFALRDEVNVDIIRVSDVEFAFNRAIQIDYDTFQTGEPQFFMTWNPTVNITSNYIGGALSTAAVMNVTTGVFIPAIFSDTNQYNIGANPGFSAITFINELSVVQSNGNFNLPGALVMNIGLVHSRRQAGTSTATDKTGISFSPQTRATVNGAIMTMTNGLTAVRCSPTFSTVAGSTVNLGTIIGLNCFQPAAALFQPGAGTENMTAYYGLNMPNMTFGGAGRTIAAVRSLLNAATNVYHIDALGTAPSRFGGDVAAPTFNDVPLTDAGVATNFLDETGNYSVPTGLGGQVDSVTGGTNINVTGTAVDPVVNLDAAITGVSVNGVTLSNAGVATNYLDETGNYSVPSDQIADGTVTDSTLRWTGAVWEEETLIRHSAAGELTVLNAGLTNQLVISDTTQVNFNFTNNLWFDGAQVSLRDGTQLQMRNTGNSDSFTTSMDGTEILFTGINNDYWRWVGGISSRFRFDGALGLLERVSAPADAATYGQFWVRDDVPNVPMFTDDTGVDYNLLEVQGGSSIIAAYRFQTSTTEADPGNGNLRYDNATPASVTELYISTTTDNGVDLANILGFIAAGDRIYVQQDNDSTKYLLFDVNVNVDNTTWHSFEGSVSNSGTIPDNNAKCHILVLYGAGTSGVTSVTGGTNINVTGTAADPVVNLDAAVLGISVNGVTLSNAGAATAYLDETGAYSVPAGSGGAVDSVSGGTNINVTGTGADPIVNLDAAITGVSVNGVTLSNAGAATSYLNEAGGYSVPPDTIVTSLPAGSITAGNLISTVLLFETAVATNSAFKIPFLNTTGNVSGNFGVQFDDGASSFTYNPSTNTFSVAIVSATTVAATLVNGIALTTGGVATNYLDETGAYSVPPSSGITQLTGDVTAGPGSGSQVATIPANTVDNTQLADMAGQTVKVRTVGSGDPQDLSVVANRIVGNVVGVVAALQGSEVNTMLPNFTTGLDGLAPASGGGTTNFLRADGTWAVPAGGSGTIGGSIAVDQVAVGSGVDAIEGVATLTYNSTTRFLSVGTSALQGNLELHDEGRIILRSTADGDSGSLQYLGTGDFMLDADVTTLSLRSNDQIDLVVDNGQAIQFRDGVGTGNWVWDNATRLSWDQDLRLDDNNRMNFGDAADAFMYWNGSIMVCDVLSTGNWSFESPLVVRSGNAQSWFDATNNDRVTFTNDGTDLVVTEVGMDAVRFSSINLRFGDSDVLSFGNTDDAAFDWNNAANEFRLNLLGATDEFEVRINGAQAFRTTGGGATSLGYNGVYPFSTQEYFGTGNTSGAQILAHSAHGLDVGFNVIRVLNDNVSDTLEASHCGQMAFKDAATARTLTLASNVDLDFPVSGMTHVVNAFTSGNYTITEGASTTLYYLDGATRIDTAGGCTIGPGGVANIWRESATVYYIWGTGITP